MTKAKECKVQKLIAEAVRVAARLDEVDEASVKEGAEREQMSAEIDECHRKLFAIDEEAASHYAASDAGAIFQIGVAERAICILTNSDMTAEQRRHYLPRIGSVFESLKRFIERAPSRAVEAGETGVGGDLADTAAK